MSLKGQRMVLRWLAAPAGSPGGHSAAAWPAGGQLHLQGPFRAEHKSHLLCEAPYQRAPGAWRTPGRPGVTVQFTWRALHRKPQPSTKWSQLKFLKGNSQGGDKEDKRPLWWWFLSPTPSVLQKEGQMTKEERLSGPNMPLEVENMKEFLSKIEPDDEKWSLSPMSLMKRTLKNWETDFL